MTTNSPDTEKKDFDGIEAAAQSYYYAEKAGNPDKIPQKLTLSQILDKLAESNIVHFEGHTADVGPIKITFRKGGQVLAEPPNPAGDRLGEDEQAPDLYRPETWQE